MFLFKRQGKARALSVMKASQLWGGGEAAMTEEQVRVLLTEMLFRAYLLSKTKTWFFSALKSKHLSVCIALT